jgi:hypothetical protein
MKNLYKIFIAAALCGGVIIGCKKIPDGYLSAQIRYTDSPIQVQRGNIVQTDPVNSDGSSAPVTYELLDIRNATTHKHADSLYAPQKHYIFTSVFNADVDTTIALLNTHRQLIAGPSFDFNVHTGAFTFYETTANVPLGTYEFDIKATNQNGSKIYKNIGTFTLYDGPSYEIDAGGSAWFQDNSTANGDTGNPEVDIQQLSTTGTNAILKLVDEKGTAFDPAKGEIIARGDRSNFETYAKFHPLIASDTSLTCNFEITPFPFSQSAYGYLIYYRIPSQFVKYDSGSTPTAAQIYSANPRFAFRLFQEGTYLITVHVPHVTRTP